MNDTSPGKSSSCVVGYVRVDYVEAALAWQRLAESPEQAPDDQEPSTTGFRSEQLRSPRMHKVYLGCLENKGGFRPIRDPRSKWYISERDMPDSKVLLPSLQLFFGRYCCIAILLSWSAAFQPLVWASLTNLLAPTSRLEAQDQ